MYEWGEQSEVAIKSTEAVTGMGCGGTECWYHWLSDPIRTGIR